MPSTGKLHIFLVFIIATVRLKDVGLIDLIFDKILFYVTLLTYFYVIDCLSITMFFKGFLTSYIQQCEPDQEDNKVPLIPALRKRREESGNLTTLKLQTVLHIEEQQVQKAALGEYSENLLTQFECDLMHTLQYHLHHHPPLVSTRTPSSSYVFYSSQPPPLPSSSSSTSAPHGDDLMCQNRLLIHIIVHLKVFMHNNHLLLFTYSMVSIHFLTFLCVVDNESLCPFMSTAAKQQPQNNIYVTIV